MVLTSGAGQWLAACEPFGRIAIANSDAAADAMTEGAIGAAHYAAHYTVSAVVTEETKPR